MSSAQADTVDRLPLRTKFFFGIGSVGDSIILATVGSYAMLYYNQILGLNAVLAGLAVSASLVFDGFADPVIGSLSDRTRGRFGRRHGYLFLAPLPIALSVIAVFNPPPGASDLVLFLWFALSVSFMRVSISLFNTPHLALGGELSSDYIERSKVLSWNNFFTWAGGAGMNFLALHFVFKAGCGLAAMALLLASAWFTRDQIRRLPKAPDNLPRFSPLEFLKDVGKALGNRNYLWLLIAFFFLSMMIGVRSGLNLYVNTFFWGLASEQLKWFVIGSFVGYATGFLFSARMHRRLDKRLNMIIWAIVFSIGPA
ncbi:MAG: MFS transporter, partial [Phenylobacterium sp.]|nr:MFS transporter [Phenylobacterium sp.]